MPSLKFSRTPKGMYRPKLWFDAFPFTSSSLCRYGDKELKVAIINQIKQQFRALFEKKPELLVPTFQLAMLDALSFNAKTNEGGMDGSILYRIDQPEYAKLKPAAVEVERIRSELVDKTQVTKADLIAFAGAVAIEATGTSVRRVPGYKPLLLLLATSTSHKSSHITRPAAKRGLPLRGSGRRAPHAARPPARPPPPQAARASSSSWAEATAARRRAGRRPRPRCGTRSGRRRRGSGRRRRRAA
jgi:hypothetical protein